MRLVVGARFIVSKTASITIGLGSNGMTIETRHAGKLPFAGVEMKGIEYTEES